MDILLISELNFRQEQIVARHLLSLAANETFKNWNWFFTEGIETSHQSTINKIIPPHNEKIEIEIPSIDKSRCQYCGSCLKSCKSNALHLFKEVPDVVLDAAVCSGCGKCIKGCSRDFVISARKYKIGEVKSYKISPKVYYFNASLLEGQQQIKNLLDLTRKIINDTSMNFIEIASNFNQVEIFNNLHPTQSYILYAKGKGAPANFSFEVEQMGEGEAELSNEKLLRPSLIEIDFEVPKEIQNQLYTSIMNNIQ